LKPTWFASPRIGLESPGVGIALLASGILMWLWPIGTGGAMPVGGDVTQFFLGLMAFYGNSLAEGRLPVWNDLWGYGFPGLAESQMGVFYPVHVILYRWLNTETAYVVSLLMHTLWGGLGAYWASRRIGTSRSGATLAAFCWTTCGFFLVHLAHPWGYTTGCWMPWTWGLGIGLLTADPVATPHYPILLALVLAVQLLPGHFQLAFITQCGLVLMVAHAVIEHLGRRGAIAPELETSNRHFRLRGALIVLFMLAWAFPLAAAQLVPTARLAQIAQSQREFGYLSDFASPPFHFVNYVAPGLFHRSPLWRPLVWDPFHAMPEEHLTYVGLVPLFVACMTIFREWGRDARVRMLAVLAVVTVVLSLGPYVPGFRYLILVPGFSFFRAPSRWSVATALALALLAGKGFDRWPEWVRPGRSLRRLAVISICWVAVTLGLIELALLCTGQPGWPEVSRGFQSVFRALPWKGEPSFATVLAQARRPQADRRVAAGRSQTMLVPRPANERIFTAQRFHIYSRELAEAAALLILVLVLATASSRGWLTAPSVRHALLFLTFLDLWVLGLHRLVDVGPYKPLVEQSPVLASLAREPRGTRIADRRLRNLPMRIGLAPISAYRTLDLPVVGSLTALALGSLADPRMAPEVQGALRATGTGARLFDPVENREDEMLGGLKADRKSIDDPVLASVIFEASWVAEQEPWAQRFAIWRPESPATRAWFVPGLDSNKAAIAGDWSGDPRHIIRLLHNATPLAAESKKPEEWTIVIEASEPGWAIVTQLADPQWKATCTNPNSSWTAAPEIRPAFQSTREPTGWQCIAVPAPGLWIVNLKYEANDLRTGLMISAIAWALWLVVTVSTGVLVWRRSAPPRRSPRNT
jgi:hypothetical protein